MLLLVVVVGAGFYFRMQGGASLGFLSGLFGKEAPKAPPPPPTPVPAPSHRSPSSRRTPKGQLLGKPFAVDKAVFSEGALVLRQTQGEVELRIYLPGNKWETPTDKKFKFENATGADVPRVHVSWKEEGKTELTHQEFAESIRLNSNSVRRRTGSCRARSSSRCRTRARARLPARSRPMSVVFASSMANPTWARIPWTRSNTSRCEKF